MANKMTKCKTCGADIAKNAKSCPSCGAKNKPNGCVGCLGGILIALGIIIIVVAVTSGGDTTNNTTNSATITKAEFDLLQNGMTYEQCVEIIGGEGEMSSESAVANIKMAIYTWKGEGGLGANANATFQNGKLTGKAQLGLK